MWKARLARVDRSLNQLDFIVVYSNGSYEFSETVSTKDPQNDTWLADIMAARISQLESLDTFQDTIDKTTIGIDFTKSELKTTTVGTTSLTDPKGTI